MENAGWMNDGKAAGDGPIEFLEVEPSAYRLSEAPREKPSPTLSATSVRLLGLGGLVVVLLALIIMARPSGEDPFDQLPLDKQQEIRQRQAGLDAAPTPQDGEVPQRTTDTTLPQPVPTPSAGATFGLAPVPPLRPDLSLGMPGLLHGYGPGGSVVQIRRSDEQPNVIELPSVTEPGSMQFSPFDELPLLLVDGVLFAVLGDGQLESTTIGAHQILPADDGIVLVIEDGQSRQVIISNQPNADSGPLTMGYDVELLGSWRGQPLIQKAGSVWLLDDQGRAQPVSDGVAVGYDGQHLVMVRCDGPDDCRIEVGPPDRPGQRSVPIPENLAAREIQSWTGRVAVSRDGSRLAVVDRRGLSLPTWIDLDTGEDHTRSESINPDSPVAWSPDGRWLAYAFGDDIIVWDTVDDKSWRIFIDRPITDLAWTLDS